MAFFKFRLPGQTATEPQGNVNATPAESVEAMRRRARHRLIGASVLVVLGVVGFPLLFDTQPRPVSVDIAIDIPDRANAKPLVPATSKPLATTAALDPKEEVVTDSKTTANEPKTQDKPEASVAAMVPKELPKTETKPEAKSDSKVEVKPDSKTEVAKAPEGKPSDTKESAGRFVVQVGAFSDEAKAREVRSKLEKAGLKTYTQVTEGKDGHRTRVRVGPFSTRDEADKTARKIKQLQLQPQVLTL